MPCLVLVRLHVGKGDGSETHLRRVRRDPAVVAPGREVDAQQQGVVHDAKLLKQLRVSADLVQQGGAGQRRYLEPHIQVQVLPVQATTTSSG